ncbi:MAG: hypothetical protein V1720_07120 [bacterium]
MKQILLTLFLVYSFYSIENAQEDNSKNYQNPIMENISFNTTSDMIETFSENYPFYSMNAGKNYHTLFFNNIKQMFAGVQFFPQLINKQILDSKVDYRLLVNYPKASVEIHYNLLEYPAEVEDTQKDTGISKNIYYFVGGAAVAAIIYLIWNKSEDNSNSTLTFGKPQLP